MNRFLRSTQFTLNLAAPVECARAPLDDDHFLGAIAPAAAHQIAAIDADRGVVALAAVRPLDAEPGVARAEARRRLQVDQVLRAGRLVVRVVRLQLEVVSA